MSFSEKAALWRPSPSALTGAEEAFGECERLGGTQDTRLPQGERRQVAILFADLSGFTALSHSLDAEQVHELVSRFTSLVDRIIADYGGSVDKHIGDAVFGAPRAHDDNALRAARTAIDIRQALAGSNDSAGPQLQARIGIACGEVVAGVLPRSDGHDYTVLGDSLNLAARLVAAAAPGQTLLSEGVVRLLGPRGVCEPLEICASRALTSLSGRFA